MTPFDIMPTGVTGIAVILNEFLGTPIGFVTFLLNIPIQIMGYYLLPRGFQIILKTIFVVVVYSLSLDLLSPYLPTEGISENLLLNAIFAGVLGGIGGGILIRAGGSYGGTATVALIVQRKLGTSMSTTYLYVDGIIIVMAGFIFGWESALYAIITLFIGGVATDYVLEGPSVIRTAFIVTEQPEVVAQAIFENLDRGVTGLNAVGMYSGEEKRVLYVTLSRAQVAEFKELIASIDPDAFVVIGQGHVAYGEGFRRM